MEPTKCPYCNHPSATPDEAKAFILRAVETARIHRMVGVLIADMVDGLALLDGACLKCVRADKHMQVEDDGAELYS